MCFPVDGNNPDWTVFDMEKRQRLAYSINEWCDEHRISRSFYYELQKKNQGPKTMKVGARRLISHEAAAAWRRQMEAVEA